MTHPWLSNALFESILTYVRNLMEYQILQKIIIMFGWEAHLQIERHKSRCKKPFERQGQGFSVTCYHANCCCMVTIMATVLIVGHYKGYCANGHPLTLGDWVMTPCWHWAVPRTTGCFKQIGFLSTSHYSICLRSYWRYLQKHRHWGIKQCSVCPD